MAEAQFMAHFPVSFELYNRFSEKARTGARDLFWPHSFIVVNEIAGLHEPH